MLESSSSPASSNRIWLIGPFRFDALSRELRSPQGRERLPVKAAEVLTLLCERAGEVVSRDWIIERVWEGNIYTGPRGLTYTIWLLRRALDAQPPLQGEHADAGSPQPSAIETISRTGYLLRAPTRLEATTAPSEPADTNTLPAPSTPRGQRWPTLGLISIILLLAAGWAWHTNSPQIRAPRAPTPLTLLDGVEDFPALAPDGKRLAYVWSRSGAPAQLRVAVLADPQHTRFELEEPDASINAVTWIDNNRIAYARIDPQKACEVVIAKLREQTRQKLTDCFDETDLPMLSASSDGQWLALARSLDDGNPPGIILHHLADGQERVLTHPPDGLGDYQLAWAPDNQAIAFLRDNDATGDLYRVDVDSGHVTRLTHDDAWNYGVAWSRDSRWIYFNSNRGGRFGLWRIPASGGEPQLVANLDNARNLVALADGSGDLAVSVFRFADHIGMFRLADGKAVGSIASSGRDLYARACPDADRVVFLSMRSGNVALWANDRRSGESHPLRMPAGTPDLPSCSPVSARYASVLNVSGGRGSQLLVGDLSARAPPTLSYQDGHQYGLPVWAPDGRSLIIGGDRDGDWKLWRFTIETQHFSPLTDSDGLYGQEVLIHGQRWLYYTRPRRDGIWRMPLNANGETSGAQPSLVVADFPFEDWGNWQWFDGALYLLRRSDSADQLLRRDADGTEQLALSWPAGSVRRYASLSIAADGTALVSMTGPRQADIVRVPVP